MSSIPVEPDIGSFTTEELLARVRGGLRAERELIGRYAELYARDDSTPHRVLKAIYRSEAEGAGTDLVSVVGMLLAVRGREILQALRDHSTAGDFEAAVVRRVRRVLWKLRKRYQRGPTFGDTRLDQAQAKGYQPESNGDARSTILFGMLDERLESAMRKARGKSESERKLNEVLARLYVLKGWRYEKLALLVFGPGLEEDELGKAADRIRKWIKEPVGHVRAEKKRNQERKKQDQRRDDPGGGPMEERLNGDDPAGGDLPRP